MTHGVDVLTQVFSASPTTIVETMLPLIAGKVARKPVGSVRLR